MLLYIFLFLFVGYNFWYRRIRYPPGPTPLPFIGNFHQIDLANPHRTILMWKRIYGPVFTIWIPKPIVVLCSHEILEQTLVQESEAFSGRPTSFLYRLFTGESPQGDGIILSFGKRWQAQRQFALRALKTFGFGKKDIEEKINFHLDRLLEHMHQQVSKEHVSSMNCSVNMHQPLAFCVGNIIHDIVMGRIYDYGDTEFAYFKKLIDSTLEQVQSVSLLVADSFPFLAPFMPAYYKYRRNGQALQDFFLHEIDKHEKALRDEAYTGPPRDFIEAYLQEMEKKPDSPYLSKFTLALNSGDLWTGGMETTVTTIRWGIIYLIHYPDVQEAMFDELDEVLGSERVTYADRTQLPYTCATIAELQRLANVLPWNIPHMTTRTACAGGFMLPAGTDVMAHLGAVHHDPDLYEDPDDFQPERFLLPDGSFSPGPYFAPFSLGKRSCLGEHLARVELLLIFATLVQHFEFRAAGTQPSLERRMGMTSVPYEYKCTIVPRK